MKPLACELNNQELWIRLTSWLQSLGAAGCNVAGRSRTAPGAARAALLSGLRWQ